MLGARKMQVNETGQQMGVDQLAARTVRDSGRVAGNSYLADYFRVAHPPDGGLR